MADDSRVDVQVHEGLASDVPEDLIRRVAGIALDRCRVAGPDRVTVLIADDDTLRSLNRDFRGADETTDVLAFSAREGWSEGHPPEPVEAAEAFPLVPGEVDHLGDIAISYPQTERQAKAAGTTIDQELALLVAHGVLHLLGFDHSDSRQEAAMSERTRSILAEAFSR